jgi:periplasmic divalent cation tolerance protein
LDADPKNAIVVTSTAGSEEEAAQIGKTLVRERLAACVQIVPNVRSLYVWRDEFIDDREWLLVIKTRRSLFDSLKARILELHRYEVPEIVSLALEDGHKPYLSWLMESTALNPDKERE